MTMTTIIETIRKAHFVASVGQVEQLARTVQEGAIGAATYLAILIVACQGKLGAKRGRKPSVESQTAVIDSMHTDYYAAVLRGVGDSASDDKENHRRATFARSACSTLRGYVRTGGDIRTLDATTITKSALVRMQKPPEPTDRLARRWMRAHDAVMRAAKRLAATNADFAAESLEVMIEELQTMLNDLPEADHSTTQAGETTIFPGQQRPRGGGQGSRPGAMIHSPA